MITDSPGYGRTKALYLKWKKIQDDFVASKPVDADKEWHDRVSAMQYDLNQLSEELNDYLDLASGKIDPPELVNFDSVGTALVRWKIARGWTEEEIAERTGIDLVLIFGYINTEFRIATLEDASRVRWLFLSEQPNQPFDYCAEAIADAPNWANAQENSE